MHTNHDIEAELSELLATSTNDLSPPVGSIIEEGVRRGRRMQRNARIRNAAVAAGVLAATVGATVGIVGVADRPTGANHAPNGFSVAAGSASQSGASSKTASATRPTATKPSAAAQTKPTKHVTLSKKKVETILGDLLPPGHFARMVTVSGPEDTNYWADYYPGKSGFQVSVTIISSNSKYATVSSCPGLPVPDEGPRPPGATPASCEGRNLPDGGHLLVLCTEVDQWGFYDYELVYDRPDGAQVTMTLANGVSEPSHGNPVTVNAAKPPLTMDQMVTIVESDRWN